MQFSIRMQCNFLCASHLPTAISPLKGLLPFLKTRRSLLHSNSHQLGNIVLNVHEFTIFQQRDMKISRLERSKLFITMKFLEPLRLGLTMRQAHNGIDPWIA